MLPIQESLEKSSWELIYEDYYIPEPVCLRQVIKFDGKLLITFSLKNSKKLMLLFFDNFIVRMFKTPFDDEDTVIAEGSMSEFIVVFQNTKKEFWVGKLTEKKFIFSKKYTIYNERVKEVVSACLVKNKDIVYYIYAPGGVGQINLDGSGKKNLYLIAKGS